MKEKPDNNLFILQWIWKSYLCNALIPLLLIELVFIGMFFLSNNWSQREMLSLLKNEVRAHLQEIAQRECLIISEQISDISPVAAANADKIINTVTNQILNLDLPWQGYGLLLGKDGTVLALPDKGEKDWVLNELTNHHYNEAALKDAFAPDQFNLYKRPDLAAFGKQVAGKTTGFASINLGGMKQAVSWATVTGTGWKLLIIAPENNIYSNADKMNSRLLKIGSSMLAGLVLLYCIFFFILFKKSHKMSNSISQPLLEINNIIQRIVAGDYFQKQRDLGVHELQETASLLIHMGQQLETANENLLHIQAKLKKKESDLQALIKSIDDIIFEVDENGIFKNVWTNSEKILLMPVDQVIGNPIQSIIAPDKSDTYLSKIKQVIENQEPDVFEYMMDTLYGRRWYLVRVAPIASELKSVSVSMRDISERKEMEKSIIAAKEEAEKASMAKSQFLSNMSHELRTPLNAVLGFSQILQMDKSAPLDNSQSESVKEIVKAGNHLLMLINEILDLAKIESGKLNILIEPVKILPIIEETVAFIKPLAKENDIEIAINPRDCMEQYVLADSIRLKQVLLNLFSNAVKYNYNSGKVSFYCEKIDKFIRFNILDSGLGIPSAQLPAIFDPFYRLPITANNVEGTGIGLAAAKQLVELMGGNINVKSQEGQGSHFWFDIPCAEAVDRRDI
jgi:PAS domain S-box-containing protein